MRIAPRTCCLSLVAWIVLSPPVSADIPTVTLKLLDSDTGRTFEGIGAVSAGASSRLLVDYAEPYRSDILDYLFKPRFGAGFQHLKVEIGGGENSTCGSEPTHANTRAELTHPVSRGYELWLMREARQRNPRIELDCLPWTYPAWVKGAFSQDATDWIIGFLDLARQQQTPLDWVSAGWNERGTNRDWVVKSLRPSLDAQGYAKVSLQAPDDSNKFWQIFDTEDQPFQNAIKAAGYHYVNGREPWTVDQAGNPSTLNAKASGKPLWDSEEWSQSGKTWEMPGAMLLARVLNKMYIRDRVVKTEIWCPIASIYPSLPWSDTGAMEAISPWSGHYTVWPTIWALAHTTQFVQPGWTYLDRACGQITPETWNGSYVTLKDPATGDWSTIVCTDAATRFTFKVSGELKTGPVHIWRSDAKTQFIQQPDLAPATDGSMSAELTGDSIYSFTTTSGQSKGETPHPIPTERAFPLPFREDFKEYKNGQTAKYFSDQQGTFEVANDPDKGKCLTQITVAGALRWAGWSLTPYTIFGDRHWTNYSVSADVKIKAGSVEVGGRFGANDQPRLSYRWIVSHHGKWALVHLKKVVLATGTLDHFDATRWHHMKIVFNKSQIQGWIDGEKLTDVQDTTEAQGMADLATSYDPNLFTNVAVSPVQ